MSRSGSWMTRMRARAGLLLLYFGVAWKAEQITSHARQPLHLSASILMVLIFFLTLPIDNPSLLQVVGDVRQIQLLQRLFRGNALFIPSLVLVVGIQELLFQFGKS